MAAMSHRGTRLCRAARPGLRMSAGGRHFAAADGRRPGARIKAAATLLISTPDHTYPVPGVLQ
jgi:hypothetical protein